MELQSVRKLCSETCTADPNSCLEVGDPQAEGITAEVPAGLSYLHEMLSDGDVELIPASELRAKFGLTEDVCHRSDTRIYGEPVEDGGGQTNVSRIENTGDICRVSSEVQFGGRTVGSRLIVPGHLNYRLEADAENVVLTKPSDALPAILLFSDDDLQKDFGGNISVVELRKAEAFVTTDNGCTWLRFGP